MEEPPKAKAAASLRWKILRQASLQQKQQNESENDSEVMKMMMNRISRRSTHGGGFNMIPSTETTRNDNGGDDDTICVSYTLPSSSSFLLPCSNSYSIYLLQRPPPSSSASLTRLAADFGVCNQHDIDNTGLVCPWPSEDVLAHFCLSNPHLFHNKSVIELGSGYGLAGMVIAAATRASRVVISDGNPQVVDYIQRSIHLNNNSNNNNSSPPLFGDTQVTAMHLHWNHHHHPPPHQEQHLLNNINMLSNAFDIIVASDCTFFKDSHKGLVRTLKLLMNKRGHPEALFFSPKRGDTLDKFLVEVKENGLHFTISEEYDEEVSKRHHGFVKGGGDVSWPNYEKDHCYPLLEEYRPSILSAMNHHS